MLSPTTNTLKRGLLGAGQVDSKAFQYTPPNTYEEFKAMYERDKYPTKVLDSEIMNAYNWYMFGRLDGVLSHCNLQVN